MYQSIDYAKMLSRYVERNLDNIDDVLLFGSVARNESDKGSDLDLLVTMNGIDPKIHNLFNLEVVRLEPLFKYGIGIGPNYGLSNKSLHILYCSKDQLIGSNPILENIRDEGISLIH